MIAADALAPAWNPTGVPLTDTTTGNVATPELEAAITPTDVTVPAAAAPVAVAALEGLAAMQPADLRDRLAPLMAETVPPTARAAAHRALEAHGACR